MKDKSLRLGSISFINSLPVDLGLISGQVETDAEIFSGAPSMLNEDILSGSLDVSPVSALWYAEHQDKFLLLPDLSISSESGVGSVLLFSRYPMKQLKGRQITITKLGHTTPALLEILCRSCYRFKPDFKVTNSRPDDIPENTAALLLIGNDALMAKERLKTAGYHIMDLAEEWRAWTALPFVFAVWVVSRDVFLTDPKKVHGLHEALLRSKKWGAEHPKEIIEAAEKNTRLPVKVLQNYFSKLSYDLNEGLKCGLKLYCEYAVRYGMLKTMGEFEEIDLLGRVLPLRSLLATTSPS